MKRLLLKWRKGPTSHTHVLQAARQYATLLVWPGLRSVGSYYFLIFQIFFQIVLATFFPFLAFFSLLLQFVFQLLVFIWPLNVFVKPKRFFTYALATSWQPPRCFYTFVSGMWYGAGRVVVLEAGKQVGRWAAQRTAFSQLCLLHFATIQNLTLYPLRWCSVCLCYGSVSRV